MVVLSSTFESSKPKESPVHCGVWTNSRNLMDQNNPEYVEKGSKKGALCFAKVLIATPSLIQINTMNNFSQNSSISIFEAQNAEKSCRQSKQNDPVEETAFQHLGERLVKSERKSKSILLGRGLQTYGNSRSNFH